MYPIVLEGFNFQYILTKGKRKYVTDNILTFPFRPLIQIHWFQQEISLVTFFCCCCSLYLTFLYQRIGTGPFLVFHFWAKKNPFPFPFVSLSYGAGSALGTQGLPASRTEQLGECYFHSQIIRLTPCVQRSSKAPCG